MEKYIILGFVAFIVFAPAIAWRVHKIHRFSQRKTAFVSKPFACPRCGHRFITKQRCFFPVGEDKALLKCPSCGKRDVCSRPHDLDTDQK